MRRVPLRASFRTFWGRSKICSQSSDSWSTTSLLYVCKLIYVNPATSAAGDKSFRQQPDESRRGFDQKCCNCKHVSTISRFWTHKHRFDKLCLVSVANSFVSLNENHERNVGKFTTADLSRWTCCFPLLLRYMHCSRKFTSAYQLSSFPSHSSAFE